MATVHLKNPFNTTAIVTSASGHHTPWGGNGALDLDVSGHSRGWPVDFEVTGDDVSVRGWIEQVTSACESGVLADGGFMVKIKLQKLSGGIWSDTGDWALFAHLDPISVVTGYPIYSGASIGYLGPYIAQYWPDCTPACGGYDHSLPGDSRDEEYHSSCACHSHVHVEGSSVTSLASGAVSSSGTIMQFTV